MKEKNIIESTYNRNESQLYNVSQTVFDGIGAVESMQIDDDAKRSFFASFKDAIEFDKYYVFRITKEKTRSQIPHFLNITHHIEVKEVDTVNTVMMTYDDSALRHFKKQNGFWKRLKLCIKYLFRRKI